MEVSCINSPFLGTVYEPFDFLSDGSHIMVIHANPSVSDSPALNHFVRSREEMQELSDAAYGLFREALSPEIELKKLPIEGFLTMALGFKLLPVLPEEQEQSVTSDLCHRLELALPRIFESLDIMLCLSVSAMHANTQNVFDAYQEAFSMAVHYPFLPNASQIIFFRDLQIGLSTTEAASKKLLEQQFFTFMTEERYLEAESILLQLTQLRASTPRTVTSLTQELISRLNYFAYQFADGANLPSVSQERLIGQIDRVRSVKSMGELRQHLHAILQLFDSLRITTQNASDLSWSGKLADYIKNNYANPALNAALLGQTFHLNPAYISHIFHQGTGLKLVDFLHLTRIEHIKALLKRTDMRLADIAEKTGYYDRRSMSRVFRRYVGLTPSEYRTR